MSPRPLAKAGRGRCVAAAALVGLGACGTPAPVEWVLFDLNGRPALADVPVTLRISGRGVSGVDGCNIFTASLVDGPAGRGIADARSTLRACESPDAMRQSIAVAAVLGADPILFLTDGVLVVTGPRGEMRFVRP